MVVPETRGPTKQQSMVKSTEIASIQQWRTNIDATAVVREAPTGAASNKTGTAATATAPPADRTKILEHTVGTISE